MMYSWLNREVSWNNSLLVLPLDCLSVCTYPDKRGVFLRIGSGIVFVHTFIQGWWWLILSGIFFCDRSSFLLQWPSDFYCMYVHCKCICFVSCVSIWWLWSLASILSAVYTHMYIRICGAFCWGDWCSMLLLGNNMLENIVWKSSQSSTSWKEGSKQKKFEGQKA